MQLTEQIVIKVTKAEKQSLRQRAIDEHTFVSDLFRAGVGLDPAPRGRAAWGPKAARGKPKPKPKSKPNPGSTRSTSKNAPVSKTVVRPEALPE